MVLAVALQFILVPACLGAAPARESWAVRHDEPSHAIEEAGSMAVNRAGDLYLAGSSLRSIQVDRSVSSIVTLAKYDPDGRQIWSVRTDLFRVTPKVLLGPDGNPVLGGPGGFVKFDPQGRQTWVLPVKWYWDNFSPQVNLDGQGNILAAGTMDVRDTTVTAIVMVNPLGELLWRTRYENPARSLDPVAIAGDGKGNVLVTGRSFGRLAPVPPMAYLTLKLDPSGTILWQASFSGPAGDEDLPNCLAADQNGNVFVAGTTALLKYDPQGNEIWRNVLGEVSEIHLFSDGDLLAQGNRSLARIDSGGNVRWVFESPTVPEGIPDHFFSSTVSGDGSVRASTGSGTVVKLDGDGNQRWQSMLEGEPGSRLAGNLAAHEDGGILFSGTGGDSINGDDRWILKFDGDGQERWRVREDGPGNGDELSRDAVLDPQGNLYLLGLTRADYFQWDFLTLKLAPDGRKLWAVRHPFPAQDSPRRIALTPGGGVVISGESEDDFLTIKYDAVTGRRIWEAREPGSDQSRNSFLDMAVDQTGNIWVSGAQRPDLPEKNTTVKYDPEGRQLWLLRHETEGSVYRIKTDGQGNAYLLVVGSNASQLVKVSPEGRVIWRARAWAVVLDLALDGKGFPYLAGAVNFEGGGGGFWLARYEPALGTRLWESWYEGPPGGKESSPVLAVDREGNSWVCGASQGPGPFPEYAVVKHDPDGKLLWHQRMPSTGAISYASPRLALDSAGGAVVCGYARLRPENPWSQETALEIFRISPQGKWLWKALRPGAAYREYYPAPSLTPLVDASGNVFIAGSTFTPETFNDLEVVKYSTAAIPFLRGDCDGDGKVTGTVNDAVFLLLHLFAGGPAPACTAACDAVGDGDELLTVTEAVYLIRFNFQGGPPPPLPFPACGHDTETRLSCEEYSTCDASR